MDISNARAALKKYFGYDRFRPMQTEIIQALYDQKDALVLMPTGGGKSICYQIPAVTMPGVCVVVSPLISLMKDQVEGLRSNGIRASFLNSSLGAAEQREVEDEFFNGLVDLLYVSPEKLVSQSFQPLLKRTKINLFAIDEAHCISSWGHDFRPEYSKMKFLKREFKDVPVVALTATADKITRRDIVKQLELDEPEVFVASFDRPNLSLEVRPGQKRLEQIVQFIKQRPKQSGIIYCLSRRSTEELASKLTSRGIPAEHYHAGMPDAERAQVQEDFINDNAPIICATVAFGMGIDKSNVRWIIHYNLPKNIESYYQEIGRAGRDGVKADTLLFYSYGDILIYQDFLTKKESDQTEVKLAKLDRMRQYAESLVCRRRILLNYFSENLQENCGNCDICKNPPKSFDGTVIAQKALSAVYRLRQSVGMNLLIDVLRGSGKREIYDRGFQHIKTYGAGRDIPFSEWQNYMLQLLNMGYIEIAHDQKNQVKLTPASERVLFENEKVELVKIATVKERLETEKKRAKAKPKPQRVRDELFETLRQLRKRLAQERGIPPYRVFSDATLEEMAANKPVTDEQMSQISGVGDRKLHLFGDYFMDSIREFVKGKGISYKGSTYDETHDLIKEGFTIADIAQKRNLNETTIFSHLAVLYERGEEVDISTYVSPDEVSQVLNALKYLEEPFKLKSIHEYFDGQISYNKIRLALAHYNKAKQDMEAG